MNPPPRSESPINTVLIVNGYVQANAGDAALLAVCRQQVVEAYPTAAVQVASLEDPGTVPTFDGVPNIGSIRRFVSDDRRPRPVRLLLRALGLLVGLAYLLAPRLLTRLVLPRLPVEVRHEVTAAAQADLVVSMGGGYVHGRAGLAGWQNLYFVLLPLLIAQRHGRLTVFAPQSFGPFEGGPLQHWLVRTVASRATLLVAREVKSVRALQACRVPDTQVARGVDSAFALEATTPRAAVSRLPTGTVGITARSWLPPAEQHAYEVGLARTIDHLIVRGHPVLLVPQVTADFMQDDDRIVEARIAALCTLEPILCTDRLPYTELLTLYGECHLFVGTRFHSVIFSLLHRVPCIAIEYEHKTSGIMADLGLSAWTLPIEEVDADRLIALVDRLIVEREDYLRQLDEVLPPYVARSRAFVTDLRSLDVHG